MKKNITSFVIASLCAGCNSAGTVIKDADKISLEDALVSVGTGLNKMRNAQGSTATGLIPDTVEVTFNVSVSAKDTNKLLLDVGAPTKFPVSATLGADNGSEKNASRGNEIKIKFVNILTAGNDSYLRDKTPEQVKEILNYLTGKGVEAFFFPVPQGVDKAQGSSSEKK